ncbi:hypothetical protein [Nostoc sp.]
MVIKTLKFTRLRSPVFTTLLEKRSHTNPSRNCSAAFEAKTVTLALTQCLRQLLHVVATAVAPDVLHNTSQ